MRITIESTFDKNSVSLHLEEWENVYYKGLEKGHYFCTITFSDPI